MRGGRTETLTIKKKHVNWKQEHAPIHLLQQRNVARGETQGSKAQWELEMCRLEGEVNVWEPERRKGIKTSNRITLHQ